MVNRHEIGAVLLQAGVAFTALEEVRLLQGQTIYRVAVPHTTAFDHWRALRERVGQTALWPVITRPGLDLFAPSAFAPADLLAAASAIDLDAWIARRKDPGAFVDPEETEGTWPDWLDPDDLADYDPEDYFELDEMFVTTDDPPISIILLPVHEGWQVFTLMAPTGRNSQQYNSVELHIALHKHWSDRYGVELVAITEDAMELFVARPPDSPPAAMQLAWEHFAYCNDAVYQNFENVGSVAELAARYLRRRAWHFWWD
jgi:hypothetical protein